MIDSPNRLIDRLIKEKLMACRNGVPNQVRVRIWTTTFFWIGSERPFSYGEGGCWLSRVPPFGKLSRSVQTLGRGGVSLKFQVGLEFCGQFVSAFFFFSACGSGLEVLHVSRRLDVQD